MDRRAFLTTAGAVTATAALSARERATAAVAGNDAKLNGLFQRIFDERIQNAPALATSLGLDKGPNARLRSTFDPEPAPQARAKEVARIRRWQAQVQAVPVASLSQAGQLNREIVLYGFQRNLTAPTRFDLDSVQSPYLITQQDGAYFSIPDFLNSQHPIETRADAEAYLSRLGEFGRILDFETAEQKRQAAKGRVAPAWSLDLALGQMRKLRSPGAADSGMVRSIAERTRAKNIPGDWAARAAKIVESSVYPALDRQMALVEQLKRTTQPGDGAVRIPNGDAIYAAALAEATTTTMTPDEVHKLGLSQVAEYTGLLDSLLKQAGYTHGTVGERLAALNKDPKQLYPDSDAGRAQLIADLNAGVKAMTARLPQAFATLPKQPLEIRRVPIDIQDGASNGYYNSASLDGSRPAIYWINLKSTGDWPRYSLPSLTYHEGVPGHHLQISLAQASKDIPMLRKISFFNSYVEGWALYAEQLSDEIGGYTGIERAGYLQSFLFRSARLVVDTGLNHLGWSRERAVDYMTATTGFPRPRVQREVERYCASIGQACSYKVGHLAWLRAREAAKAQLGAKFDIRQFHEVLKDGAMPLTILERRVRERAAAQARA
ncbi:DUF885 family protein [Sphingomonas sp. KRR8]|uniref:DUF885 domain-containing protein n=1 Tax=Sphingomonas sp. KRR8 TaxID=2942996 RepID=UPI0020218726|nr:DUF885 family protein [Sphingomonas sp. KRR8]URD60917.1 DUF885 family protein [Sphingomonas sp. KRR8]